MIMAWEDAPQFEKIKRRNGGKKRRKKRRDWWRENTRRRRVNGVHPHDAHVRSRLADRYGGELPFHELYDLARRAANEHNRQRTDSTGENRRDPGVIITEVQSRSRVRALVYSDFSEKWYHVIASLSTGRLVTSLPLSKRERLAILRRTGVVVDQLGRNANHIWEAWESGENLPQLSVGGDFVLVCWGIRWYKLAPRDGIIADLDLNDVKALRLNFGYEVSKHGLILQGD